MPPLNRYRPFGLLACLTTPLIGGALGAVGPVVPRQTAAPTVTAVSGCHLHGSTQYCMVGTTEYRVSGEVTATANLPSSYTSCHTHGTQTWCMAGNNEVRILGNEGTATSATPAAATATITSAAETGSAITAVSECHLHGSELLCMAGTTEYHVQTTVTATTNYPASFTGCHSHGFDTYCMDANGKDIELVVEGAATEDAKETMSTSSAGQNCHFHAGVEHCVGGSSSESETSCGKVDRDYNIPLRIGLLFVILVTSGIGVYAPILLSTFVPPRHFVLCILRQFGTGVIISTAFVHLLTHANLMFESDCIGELAFEATATSILMAGLFISFLTEYAGSRFVQWHSNKKTASIESATTPESLRSFEIVKVLVLEAGIIFHSLLIGITLVVSGDSFFLTLFAVILFHQMFEGVALGTRIAALGHAKIQSPNSSGSLHSHLHSDANIVLPADVSSMAPVSMARKLVMAAPFALITPIGMAIGIGVLKKFNGNDSSTLIALGTLNAFSAGILVWVGVVEMWAEDWMQGGEMTSTSPIRTALGMASLLAGMLLMSFLGKWA